MIWKPATLRAVFIAGLNLKAMTYRVALRKTDEGYAVSCPGLPGCWSEGQTEDEALANIREAISEYLAVAQELAEHDEAELREVEVAA
ncbi:MAG: type II toxin-antitoxin system HicB family antitoxin [Bacteroidota bacterium]